MSGISPAPNFPNIWARTGNPNPSIDPLMTNSAGLSAGNQMGLPLIPVQNRNNLPPAMPQLSNGSFPPAAASFNSANNMNLILKNFGQNSANTRRLAELEYENQQRRKTTTTLQQMSTQLLQGQMDIQEHVLQYQFMLEQCLETLDHQNSVLTEQSEEIALLRSKLRYFENFIDSYQRSKNIDFLQNTADNFNCQVSSLTRVPSMFANAITRMTATKFQPFNPRPHRPTNPDHDKISHSH